MAAATIAVPSEEVTPATDNKVTAIEARLEELAAVQQLQFNELSCGLSTLASQSTGKLTALESAMSQLAQASAQSVHRAMTLEEAMTTMMAAQSTLQESFGTMATGLETFRKEVITSREKPTVTEANRARARTGGTADGA